MSTEEKITQFLEAEQNPYPTECYAVPESDSIIDTINPATGLTTYYSKTLEMVRAEKGYELAERMTIEAFCEQKAARQHTPITWDECTEDRYYDMLEVLPPAYMGHGGFLVGEPCDHDASNGQPRYQGFCISNGKFYQGSRPMTIREFKAI
jgi:hypothetical protein